MADTTNGAPNGAPQDKPAKAKRVTVETLVTVHHREDAKADEEVLPPGRHDFAADVAEHLIARGQAVPAAAADAAAAAKAEADKGAVKVQTKGAGPKVEAK